MTDLPTLRHGRALLALLSVIVLGATLTAFAESYHGLYHWALHHHIRGIWAYLWPVQVDAFIAAGELALLLAARYLWHHRMRVLAWVISGTGLAVSILCNSGSVGAGASWQDHATAALPPVAAMGGLVAILAVRKQIAHMARRLRSVAVDRPTGPAVADPGTVRLAPATPAARAAYLAGATHDLIAAVSEVTREVTTVTRLTPGWERSMPVPLPSVTLAPVTLTGGMTPTRTTLVNPATVSLTSPPNPAATVLPPAMESVTTEATESAPEPASANGYTEAEPKVSPGFVREFREAMRSIDPAQRDLDRLHLESLTTDAERIRYAISALGHETTPVRIHEWLTDRGHGSVTLANIKSTLRRARQSVAGQSDDAPRPEVNAESETPVAEINRGAR
jgi:hypothetical protein